MARSGPPDTVLRLTCYSTEPGDDLVAQVRAGAYEIEVLARDGEELARALSGPVSGIVLVDARDGTIVDGRWPACDLYGLVGYPGIGQHRGPIALAVGDRRAATQILRRAAVPWTGDRVVVPRSETLGVFLETLHHLAAHNRAATASGNGLIRWRDVFPSEQLLSERRTRDPDR